MSDCRIRTNLNLFSTQKSWYLTDCKVFDVTDKNKWVYVMKNSCVAKTLKASIVGVNGSNLRKGSRKNE